MSHLDLEPRTRDESALTRRAPTGRRLAFNKKRMTGQGGVALAPEALDILHGYDEIGAFLRMTPKQVQHRVRAGEVPHFKLGRLICVRRSTLIQWIAEQEAASAGRARADEKGGRDRG